MFLVYFCNRVTRRLCWGHKIHYFHIDHNAPCLPPSPPKVCIPRFPISSECNSRLSRNPRQWFCKICGGGGGGVKKVHYGLCENGEYNFFSNFGNAFLWAYFGCLPSIMRSSTTDILEFLTNAFIMHDLKTGLYADKLATFWMFPERFYRSFVLQMTLIHGSIR